MSLDQPEHLKRPSVFGQFWRQQLSKLLQYARRCGCGDFSAADVAQATGVVAWQKLSALLRENPRITLPSVCRWVQAIERRKILEYLRAKKKHGRPVPAQAIGELPGSEPLPLERLVRAEQLQRSGATVDQLAPDDQEILQLFFWERLTAAQVAERLGITAQSACMRRLRAIRRLAQLLQASNREGEDNA